MVKLRKASAEENYSGDYESSSVLLSGKCSNKRQEKEEMVRKFRQGSKDEVAEALRNLKRLHDQITASLPPHLNQSRPEMLKNPTKGRVESNKAGQPPRSEAPSTNKDNFDKDVILPLALGTKQVKAARNKQENSDDEPKPKAKTLSDLEAKFQEMRGKKANYQEKILKRKLKNQIKKKQKKATKRLIKKGPKPSEPETTLESPKPESKPAVNDNGRIVFSRFDFGSDSVRSEAVKKDPKSALKEIQKSKAFLEKLKKTGREDKADEIITKTNWNIAKLKAEGVKVKDNEELLKKTIKKKEQRKTKSKKTWESREEQLQNKKKEAQNKRKENLNKKKTEKKNRKVKKAIKKGRMLSS